MCLARLAFVWTLFVLGWNAPAHARLYVEGGVGQQNYRLSNGTTDFGALDLGMVFGYAVEVGVNGGPWLVGVRYWSNSKTITKSDMANTYFQDALYLMGALAFGGDVAVEPFAGGGSLVSSRMTLSGTTADGTYSNSGLTALGGLRLRARFASKSLPIDFVVEGGYRFVYPLSFSSGAYLLGAETSGYYWRTGLRLNL